MMRSGPAIPAAFALQARWCEQLGARFSANLMRALADDWQQGGALRTLLPAWHGDPVADALALRVAGALHRLVLDGAEPALAAAYAAGAPPAPAQLAAAVGGHAALWQDYLAHAPQTNEIGRSALLLGGYALIAEGTGLPLALREIGASAGLNLLWDRFRYRLGAGIDWGDANAGVIIEADWRGTPPALPPSPIAVASRAGCDRSPIDVRDAGQRQRLLSYVWPDQPLRLARLRAALALAERDPPAVAAKDAADWAEAQLAEPQPGACLVLAHSIVWPYLPAATQERVLAAVQAAGARARLDAAFAWLRYELPRADAAPELRLTLWPAGAERLLATGHPHGAWAEWQADAIGAGRPMAAQGPC